MRWNHLPVDGGLYDQDPEMLRKFEIIFSAIDEHERSERKKQEQELDRQRKARPGRPSAGSRRRR